MAVVLGINHLQVFLLGGHFQESLSLSLSLFLYIYMGVVGSGNGVVYLTSPGRPTEIGLQLGKACYPCSR